MPKQYLFGAKTDCFRHVVTVNGEIFVYAHVNSRLKRIMSETINTIDGRILQGICKLLYAKQSIARQNGSNFIVDLAEHCLRNSERLFLLGSTGKANALAVQRLCRRYPGLQISGFSPPFQDYPFDRDWNSGILKQIQEIRPHHVVVCFGPVKQEYWIHENSSFLAQSGVQRAYGLGGTIDFLAGVRPRAPKWIESMGAEWLFRLVCEPRARFRRTLIMFKMPLYAAKTVRKIEAVDFGEKEEESGQLTEVRNRASQ